MKTIFQELSSCLVSSRLTSSEGRIGPDITRLLQRLTIFFVLFGCCGVGFSQVAIQTNVSKNHNSASTSITSPVFSTSAPNELLLAFIATDEASSPNTTVTSVTGAGLTWVLVKRTNNEAGDAEIWRAFAPAALSSVSVTAKLSQSVVSSMTVLSFTGVPSTGTNGSGAIGAVASGYAGGGAPAATLVSTHSGSLVVGVGNDFYNDIARTPLAGQSLIHQDLVSSAPYSDTFWVQQLNAPVAASGTTVTLGDSAPTSDLYNLSICEVLSGASSAAGSSQLSMSASTLAFGNEALNTKSTQTLTLTSSGTAAVTVNSAALSGTGFSMTGTTFPVTLTPGQTATLQVSFDPTVAGAASGTITLSSNSSSGSTSTVALSGTGTSPQLGLSASTLAFGNDALNTNSTQTLTLTSSGTAPVTVNSATLAGTGFSMTGATFPVTLNPGQTATLQVSFNPTATGAASGTITISSSSTSSSTSTVGLTGTGVSSQLTVSAGTLAFGNETLNTKSTQALTLTASGTTAVTVNSATLTGAGFSMTGTTFPVTLNSGQTATLQVSFDPTVAGAASGTITVSSNASSGSTATVSLTGTGTAAQLTLSTSSVSFGNDPVGTTVSQSVTLTSSGTAPVTVSGASITGTGFTFTGATFPVTLNPTIAVTVQVQFDPTATGAASGALTFSSNSTSSNTSVVNLSGTGTAAQPQVSLSWAAPTNSPVPVAGYNVYRATGSSTSFQLLNASDTATNYMDSGVVSSTSYTYYVTSVGSAGTESSPSNQVTVTVP